MGTPLAEVTFVIVDLETTGGSAQTCGITEIGAVKVRGGQVLGTFGTLVNPGVSIPPLIAALTGITDSLVASAPSIQGVLPAFLEFAGDSVLVAHNAPFDMGFLKAACTAHGFLWPNPTVVDTARLARTTLHRDEVRNCKLATLAAHFRASVQPTHRALDDALATNDVLHGLLERVAGLGVQTIDDLTAFTGRVSPAQRTKRHLADGLPTGPGVYLFRDPHGKALYVGTTSRSIRSRVRTYFTASETRRRMSEMIAIAERVDAVSCATALEARVRELRLIASEEPRYNRRSTRPHRETWLKLTAEAYPRLSVVREVRDDHEAGARYLGPFRSSHIAHDAAEALTLAFGIRTCRTALARNPKTDTPGCALAELGRCLAPCARGADFDAYATQIADLRAAFEGDLEPVIAVLEDRMALLADEERYEEARLWRERLATVVLASLRRHRISALSAEPNLVAGKLMPDGGWELHVIRHGMLAAAGIAPLGTDPRDVIEALIASAAVIDPKPAGLPAGLTEECEVLLAWLDSPGVRLARTTGALSLPIHCGGRISARLKAARECSVIDVDWPSSRSDRPVGPVGSPRSRILTA